MSGFMAWWRSRHWSHTWTAWRDVDGWVFLGGQKVTTMVQRRDCTVCGYTETRHP